MERPARRQADNATTRVPALRNTDASKTQTSTDGNSRAGHDREDPELKCTYTDASQDTQKQTFAYAWVRYSNAKGEWLAKVWVRCSKAVGEVFRSKRLGEVFQSNGWGVPKQKAG